MFSGLVLCIQFKYENKQICPMQDLKNAQNKFYSSRVYHCYLMLQPFSTDERKTAS